MPAPIIPALGAVGTAIAAAVLANQKEKKDIEKAKKRGTVLAADKYAPILDKLQKECENLRKRKTIELSLIKKNVDANKVTYESLKERKTKLEAESEKIKKKNNVSFQNLAEGMMASSISGMYSTGTDTALLSLLYDKNKVEQAELTAYRDAKKLWEEKIETVQKEIDEIIRKFEMNEGKLWKINCNLETAIILLRIEIEELQDYIVQNK